MISVRSAKEPFMDIGRFMLSLLPTTGCQEPNCRGNHQAVCASPLEGNKEGQACGRRMCWEHTWLFSTIAGIKGPLCGPHARRAVASARAEGSR